MGNWRTVNVVGTMGAEHAALLLDALDEGADYACGWDKPWACLTFSRARPSLCGLNAWPAGHMSRCGNLAERDYSVQDVAKALEALLPIAPSMLLKVHCGGEYESEQCVATISVGEGLVVVGKPERETVDTPSDEQVLGNFARNLLR
jgi:hypothetical protein